ncbi:hypothetical protein BU23DRAFT_163372 [Bimuria novae-zelandiae CBS 107.79]|uniref:ADF-H domain-containing protein n=1 Tax=Bimuria novae-zelandiae CBS 107.79 TaxID=1447943 RepID=A0A6A5VBN0_9PLEO|nr:hypothetical protein BU23DRAFT_163372 [Bimuria novae-zelandiae CBS 107.79]
MEVPTNVTLAFADFVSEQSHFALPIGIVDTTLRALSPITYPEDHEYIFQRALNRIEPVLSPKTALYLILRRENSLVAITYVPYLANAEAKALLVDNRDALLKRLGEQNFSTSIICKEIGEITDARSWEERSGYGQPRSSDHSEHTDACDTADVTGSGIRDLGYKKNKCRLCDRRMKNKIADDALDALKHLGEGGDCVQLSVNITTEILQLNFRSRNLAPSEVASHLPTSTPSFTFYHHAANERLYFIFYSPDNASVKARMKHTMAIPGLINIIANDNGMQVDQKIEIHDAEELVFEAKDERIGKFRSVYLSNKFAGTESQWKGMEEQ